MVCVNGKGPYRGQPRIGGSMLDSPGDPKVDRGPDRRRRGWGRPRAGARKLKRGSQYTVVVAVMVCWSCMWV